MRATDTQIAAGACQECGNDDAMWHLCTDCLSPPDALDTIARSLSDELGGAPGDWSGVAKSVFASLGYEPNTDD